MERPELDRYLEDTIVIDWQTPPIAERAREQSAAAGADDCERARLLYEWVRDRIAHTADAGRGEVPCSASQVLRAGTGIGFSKSHLLAALLRAVGVPTGFCYQVLRPAGRGQPSILYGFNAVRLQRRWLPLDARGNRPGIEASFELETASLAVMPDAEKGEFVYPTIFARPARVVVDVLERTDTLDELARRMPADLGTPAARS